MAPSLTSEAKKYRKILEDSREALRSFQGEGGKAELPIQGHLIIGRRR
jgi:hypothetical protein